MVCCLVGFNLCFFFCLVIFFFMFLMDLLLLLVFVASGFGLDAVMFGCFFVSSWVVVLPFLLISGEKLFVIQL